jgi:hypothetical protein
MWHCNYFSQKEIELLSPYTSATVDAAHVRIKLQRTDTPSLDPSSPT